MNLQNKVLGISASPRKKGNSDLLLEKILDGIKSEKVDSKKFFLRELKFQSCIGCEKCRENNTCALKDDFTLLYPKIINSKALVIVSPTYNYNVTALMKAFLDRLYCYYVFDNSRPRNWSSVLVNQNRKVVLAAICEQTHKQDMGFTIDAMSKPLTALGYEIIDELPVYGIFDKGAVANNENIMNKAYDMGKKLALSLT